MFKEFGSIVFLVQGSVPSWPFQKIKSFMRSMNPMYIFCFTSVNGPYG